ncbi:MAG TPA: hypothetical protein DG754_14520 [Bacteroidales bacterium]|jgi:hypothetical protein|nr:hypothetical protein [Bacteroidales bacterium]
MLSGSFINLFIKKVVVVDVYATSDSELLIGCGIFSIKQKGVSLEESFSINSFSDYPLQKLAKYPVIIILNGKGVVQKQTRLGNGEGDEGTSFYQGINDEFYKSVAITSKYAGIAFCRKEHIEQVVEFFTENSIPIIDLVVGNLFVISLFEKLGLESSYIGHGFEFTDGLITKKQEHQVQEEEEINFLEGKIRRDQILQYCAALLYNTYGRVDLSFELPPKVLESRVRYLSYKRNFPVFSALVLLLFILVLISGSLREEASIRIANMYQARVRVEKAISKEKALKSKSVELIKEANRIGNYFENHPFVLDMIGETLPINVVLKNIEVNPLTSKLVNNQEVLINSGVVLIEGVTKSPLDVTSWVNQLSTEGWVERVSIQSFTSNEKSYQFELEIYIKDV